MKKIIVSLIYMFFITIFLNTNVNAKEDIYFTNSNGVNFTEDKYNNFIRLGFSIDDIDAIDQLLYDSYEIMDYVKEDKSVTKYYRETSINNKIYIDEITENDYENEIPNLKLEFMIKFSDTKNFRLKSYPTHETSYKKLTLVSYQISSVYPNRRSVVSNLIWKKLPSVTSYDIYAARITQEYLNLIIENSQYGSMTAKATKFNSDCASIGTQSYIQSYNSSSSAWNKQNFILSGYIGIGFTSELKKVPYICINDLGMHPALVSEYSASLSFQSVVGTTVYASYQHATSNVSYNSVYQAYTFSPLGLGDVIYFSNPTLMSTYDGMGGVNLTL